MNDNYQQYANYNQNSLNSAAFDPGRSFNTGAFNQGGADLKPCDNGSSRYNVKVNKCLPDVCKRAKKKRSKNGKCPSPKPRRKMRKSTNVKKTMRARRSKKRKSANKRG
jgi:hypothetical protein